MIDNNTLPLRKVATIECNTARPMLEIKYIEDTITHVMYMMIYTSKVTSIGLMNSVGESEAMGLTVMYNSDGSLMKYDEFVKLYADYIE